MATLDFQFAPTTPNDGVSPSVVQAYNVAAATATPLPVVLATPENTEGLVVVVDVTTASGTGVTFTIEGVDRASKKTWVILTSTAKTGAGTTIMRVSASLAASANVTAQDLVPDEIVIRAAHSDSAALTYTVGVHFTS